HAKHVVINWLEWGRKDQEGGAGLILGRPPRSREVLAIPRPTAASPVQERIVNQISDLDHPCTGNNAILREHPGNNKGQGEEPRGCYSQSRGMAQLHPVQGQSRL